MKGTENRKKERKEKRREGSGQLSAPDEKKPTTETGTVNTGDPGKPGGGKGGSSDLNINK